MAYRPRNTFIVPMMLLVPTYSIINGVHKKTYPNINDGIRINGSFKTFGGTEINVNGILSIEDTAEIETWFDPRITSDCVVAICGTTKCYEIIGEPENIELRNQFMKFKVKRIKGGA